MSLLKLIPKVDRVLQWPAVVTMLERHPRPLVLKAIRTALDALRSQALELNPPEEPFLEATIVSRICQELDTLSRTSLRRVINGTGIVIHTNLGRSLLTRKAKAVLEEVAFGYANLEFNLEQGERGDRNAHVEGLLCELTGAESALVVNNNAAAVLLSLSSLAAGREVLVSRGELVEIGGSFRIPDIMQMSGAILREVGTTNRTHPSDYLAAISAETGLLLKVHCSNFAITGFTAQVSSAKLVELGRQQSLPVMIDAGSGSLLNLADYLGVNEPTVREQVREGVDVVTFSGDKLLGGPQAGIIVGKKALLNPMKKHPLLRALRIDKLTLAALEATLRLYRDDRLALADIPTLRMLTESLPDLTSRAKRMVGRLRRAAPPGIELALLPGASQAGGGALPLQELPTLLIALRVAGLSAQEIEARLRTGIVPVIGRIAKGEFLLDPRTISVEEVPALADALRSLAP